MTGQDVTVAFESKAPHTTPWLSVEYPVGQEPVELFDKLKRIGWEEDTRFLRIPPINGVQEVKVSSPRGSELFGLWTKEEARRYMPEVRRVLRTEGFGKVPWNRLTLADML